MNAQNNDVTRCNVREAENEMRKLLVSGGVGCFRELIPRKDAVRQQVIGMREVRHINRRRGHDRVGGGGGPAARTIVPIRNNPAAAKKIVRFDFIKSGNVK